MPDTARSELDLTPHEHAAKTDTAQTATPTHANSGRRNPRQTLSPPTATQQAARPFRSPALRSKSPRNRAPARTVSKSVSIRRNSAASMCASTWTRTAMSPRGMIVERADTLDLLRRDAQQLERALNQAGLKTARQRAGIPAARPGLRAERRQQPQQRPRRFARHRSRRSIARSRRRARLWPPARSRQRPRYQRLKEPIMATINPGVTTQRHNRASAPPLDIVNVDERHRRHQGHAGQQFHDLPAIADDAIEEPESARSARHQSVHPAARAIRAGRAAAQIQRSIVRRSSRCRKPRSRRRRWHLSA